MSKSKSFIESRLYGGEDQGTIQFYQLSKEIINHKKYRELSFGAQVLYSILFDRLQLSIHNKRLDDQGRYYIQFKVKPAQGDLRSFDEKPQSDRSLTEVMNANAKTVGKYKKELKDAELLLEVKEGLGRVSRMYLAKPCSGEEMPPEKGGDFTPEGKMPPETTQKLPLREDIMPPQKSTILPPNDTDLNKTYSSDTDYNEINLFKKEQRKRKETIKKTLHNSPEEVHQTLMEIYGKELLSEGIAIIENRTVSKFGYQKYLTKILDDLTGRRKSQVLFKSTPKTTAFTRDKPDYFLKNSRFRGMSEEEMNAKLQKKNAAQKKNSPLQTAHFLRISLIHNFCRDSYNRYALGDVF